MPVLDAVKLSVRVITYNHARFIRQALDSVLAQQTDFPYEIVIGEDCSTDGTRDIVVECQRRHPDRIRLLLSERNMGSRHNFIRTFEACRGQYVALLDGDDYWTSPHKLQRQVDFLDQNPDYATCFHDALMVHEDGTRPADRMVGSNVRESLDLLDILGGTLPPTSTAVLRANFRKLPDWFQQLPFCDWPLQIVSARHGKVAYLNEVLGVYRLHPGGISRGWTPEQSFRGIATMFAIVAPELEDSCKPVIRKTLWYSWLDRFFPDEDPCRGGPCGLAELHDAFQHWPSAFPLDRRERGELLGCAGRRVAFARLRAGQRSRAAAWLLRAGWHDPAWLRRRGFWSALTEICAGPAVAGWLHRQHRRFTLEPTRH
jgi:glycosyltransferase involved in cell wall biosynthesis